MLPIDHMLAAEFGYVDGMFENVADHSRACAVRHMYAKLRRERRSRLKAIKKAYVLHNIEHLGDAQFFAVMYGMTCA